MVSIQYLLKKIWQYLRLYNTVYKENLIEKWTKDSSLPFPMEDDIGISQNYISQLPSTCQKGLTETFDSLSLNQNIHREFYDDNLVLSSKMSGRTRK